MPPADLVAHYREQAANCIEIAGSLSDLSAKLSLLTMAHAWVGLAEQVVKKGGRRPGL
jgi:hypothetical protein